MRPFLAHEPRHLPATHAPREAWSQASASLLQWVHAWAPAALWRALHPLSRGAFLDAPPPQAWPTTRRRTGDGREVAVARVGTRAGASGEPVVLLPTAGARGCLYGMGRGTTMVSALRDAGFDVFVASTRLDAPDRDAHAFDDAARWDVQAAIDEATDVSGYPRAHVVGHGLGGQLALAWAALEGGRGLASMATIGSAVAPAAGGAGWWAWARIGGRRLRVPAEALARAWAPLSGGAPEDARRRSALTHGVRDVSWEAMHRQLIMVAQRGLTDDTGCRDYRRALHRLRAPLWVASSDGDAWARPARCEALRNDWRGGSVTCHRTSHALSHLDLIVHPEAEHDVIQPLIQWLGEHRVRAWREDVVTLGVSR